MNAIFNQDVASLGWWTAEDQQKLYDQRLVVVGTGGAGAGVAIAAAREGMQLTLVDPDTFDVTNINRQHACDYSTIGQNKASAVAELIGRIRKDTDTHVFTDGLSADNVDQILAGATLVVDAIDIAHADLSVLLAQKSRALGLPVFTGIEVGMGCTVTCFDPDDKKWCAENYYRSDSLDIDSLLVHIPSYTPVGMIDAFFAGELRSTPAVAAGVNILSGVMMTLINRWVFNRQHASPEFVYPYLYVFDPCDGLYSIHARKRAGHLAESWKYAGRKLMSSGFSLPSEYETI